MKNKILFGTLALAGLSLASCNDFLNDNRYPLSELTVDSEFWNSSVKVEGQINYLYDNYLGYGNGSNYGNFFFKTLSDDQLSQVNGTFQNWYHTNVPASSSYWDDPYKEIRRCNLIIEGVTRSTLEDGVKANFIAQARLNRAYQYYQLVRAYGDVPLVLTAPTDASSIDKEIDLYAPRTARNTVMDEVLKDLNFAKDNISAGSGKTVFSKDMANAMKAEICLFEAAYSRYNAKDEARATAFYSYVVEACNAVKDKYTLCGDYQSLYNSTRTPYTGIPALVDNPEVIFMKPYEEGVFMHSLLDWSSSSTPVAGITKDAFDAYLFLDGKPLASTTLDKSDVGEVIGGEMKTDEKTGKESLVGAVYTIAKPLSVRDKRLSATINEEIYFTGQSQQYDNTMAMTSTSGYGVKKFRNDHIGYTPTTTANRAFTCAPLFWLAEIYLAYAEAKAELGTLTDDDMIATINKLYARAGLPEPTKAELEAINDPAINMKDASGAKISSLLWEIRRCRRCELIMDNDIRYWDLVRWNALDRLDPANNPNIFLGANVSAAEDAKINVSQIDINNGYIQFAKGQTRAFTEREKLFPIPQGQINLNKNLTQNPFWK